MKQIIIDSRDLIFNNSTKTFKITQFNEFNLKNVKLHSIMINKEFHNISAYLENNIFQIYDKFDVLKSLTLDDGIYSIFDISNALNAFLVTEGLDSYVTITIETILKKIKIEAIGETIKLVNNNFLKLLGFDFSTSTLSIASTTYTTTNFYNLNTIWRINLFNDKLSKYTMNSSNFADLLCVILNNTSQDILYYEEDKSMEKEILDFNQSNFYFTLNNLKKKIILKNFIILFNYYD